MLLSPEGDAHHHLHPCVERELFQNIDVTFNEWRLGDDRDRVAVLGAHLQAAPRQLERCFERLIAVRHSAENDQLASPGRAIESRSQQLWRMELGGDLGVEIRARPEPKILVRGPRVAISTCVGAAAVGIDAVRESDVRTVVAGQNLTRVIFVDLRAAGRCVLEVLDLSGQIGIRRILNGPKLQNGRRLYLNVSSVKWDRPAAVA